MPHCEGQCVLNDCFLFPGQQCLTFFVFVSKQKLTFRNKPILKNIQWSKSVTTCPAV